MKRSLLTTLLSTILLSLHSLAASPQVISGAGAVSLNSDGTDDGVSFVNQNVNETTLVVPESSTVNKSKNSTGIATDTNGIGDIDFNGSSGTTNVYGSVGKPTVFMDNINAGAAKVVFYNNVHANSYTFDKSNGSTEFKGSVVLGPSGVIFDATGTLRLDQNATLDGSIFGAEAAAATIQLLDNSTINGNVTAASVTFDPQGPSPAQGATINGNVSTSIIDIGSGVLGVNGNLNLDGTSNVIELLENNAVAVPISVSQTVTVDGKVTINYRIPKFHAPRVGAYNIVQAGTGGTSGMAVDIVTNDVRYTYVGSNENGNITVTSTKDREVEAAPVRGTGRMFESLIPIAYEFPDSDLDLIEGQLGFPTAQEYNNALYQIAPNIAVAGVGRETFNTSKLFLKNFLEHLPWDRSKYYCDCACGDVKLWIDGLGSYGRQNNKNGFLGYKAETWETSLGFEKAFTDQFSAGLGFGYGHTKIHLNRFDNTNNMNTYLGLGYLSFKACSWFFDCGATVGRNQYRSSRRINFNSISRKATAKYYGNEYTGFAVAGYEFYCQGVEITPFCSLVYSHIDLDSYKENGADTLSLKFEDQSYNYVQSGLGLKGAYAVDTYLGCVIPEIHAIWMHDFNVKPLKVNASFSGLAALGGYFKSSGIKYDENMGNIGGSLSLLRSSKCTLALIYDYNKSSSYFNHQGMISLQCFF